MNGEISGGSMLDTSQFVTGRGRKRKIYLKRQ